MRINNGYKYILFLVNTKYISLSVVKNQYFNECIARKKMLLLSPKEIKYTDKSKLSFFYTPMRITESKM